jgi:NADPH-dependent curcumin reductase CurA
VLPRLNMNARVPVCGQISQYNRSDSHGPRNVGVFLDKRVMPQGFRIGSHLAARPGARRG